MIGAALMERTTRCLCLQSRERRYQGLFSQRALRGNACGVRHGGQHHDSDGEVCHTPGLAPGHQHGPPATSTLTGPPILGKILLHYVVLTAVARVLKTARATLVPTPCAQAGREAVSSGPSLCCPQGDKVIREVW